MYEADYPSLGANHRFSYSILYGMIPSSKVEGKDGQDTSGSSEFEMHFDRSIIQMMQRENMIKSMLYSDSSPATDSDVDRSPGFDCGHSKMHHRCIP